MMVACKACRIMPQQEFSGMMALMYVATVLSGGVLNTSVDGRSIFVICHRFDDFGNCHLAVYFSFERHANSHVLIICLALWFHWCCVRFRQRCTAPQAENKIGNNKTLAATPVDVPASAVMYNFALFMRGVKTCATSHHVSTRNCHQVELRHHT